MIEISFEELITIFSKSWNQGEHVVLLGPTGSGKSRLSQSILDIREHVVVLAVKPQDETLERFVNGHKFGYERYEVIKKWPPDWRDSYKIILWIKPDGLSGESITKQAKEIHRSLNAMYRTMGWTIYFDESGYIAGTLGLGQALGVLLNQGRSSKISVVMAVTRPTSVIARVPKEAFSQPRHKFIFKYENRNEIKAASEVADMDSNLLYYYQEKLKTHKEGHTDFLYIGKGIIAIVRNN